MLCCMRRTKQVEKNNEDQKIKQDGIRLKDKALKAMTKFQASFCGHRIRKKLKGEKKGDAQAAEAEMSEKKEDVPAAGGTEKKEGEGPTTTEAVPATGPKPEEPSKAGETPSKEKKGEGVSDVAAEQVAARPPPQAPAPSATSAETKSTTKASTDNSPSSKAEDAPAKEEPKQVVVPAAVTAAAAAAATPAAEDAVTKVTTQLPMETLEISQAKEKTEAVDESKTKESAQQEEDKGEELEVDQEHA
ncbi:neuromodulin-like [Glossophaga mutica]